MKKLIIGTIFFTAIITVFFFAGCKKSEKQNTKRSVESILGSLIIAEKPQNAISVVQARKNALPGKEVTVIGDIGGRRKPFIGSRAAFILADENSIASCDKHGRGCRAPWDYCCETREDIADSTVFIQVVDSSGKAIKKPLKGFGGLKELSKVIIKGVYDAATTKENIIINAIGINIVK